MTYILIPVLGIKSLRGLPTHVIICQWAYVGVIQADTGVISWAPWLASLAKLVSSKLVRDCLKTKQNKKQNSKTKWIIPEEWHLRLTSGHCIYAHTYVCFLNSTCVLACMHTRAWTHMALYIKKQVIEILFRGLALVCSWLLQRTGSLTHLMTCVSMHVKLHT